MVMFRNKLGPDSSRGNMIIRYGRTLDCVSKNQTNASREASNSLYLDEVPRIHNIDEAGGGT